MHKVSDVVKALTSLPMPQYAGEVRRVPVLGSIKDREIIEGEAEREIYQDHLKVVAVRYARRGSEWIEWAIDAN